MDYDPYDDLPYRDEPGCFGCMDNGRTRNGRRCPDCDPNWWQRMRGRPRWWWTSRVWWRIRPQAGGSSPF